MSFFHYEVGEVVVSSTIISQFEPTPKEEWPSEFKQGYKLRWKRDEAELRNPMLLINYLDAEKLALIVFEDETVALKGGE